jgi:arylsulfatase A-like enzyme
VPLLFVGPGVPPGRRVEAAVRHMDLFPTVLELLGIDDPASGTQASGESLVPLFHHDGPDRPGYSEAVGVSIGTEDNWLVSVRHEGFKYVKRANREGSWLWRLPDERTDKSRDHPDVVARMEALLERFQASRPLTATGEELSPQEAEEVADHLRDLGYLD